jgi:hypothetical protein
LTSDEVKTKYFDTCLPVGRFDIPCSIFIIRILREIKMKGGLYEEEQN